LCEAQDCFPSGNHARAKPLHGFKIFDFNSKALDVNLSGKRHGFPEGNNQGLRPCMLFSKSSNQNQIILKLYFFKTKGIITLWHVKNFNVKNPM